MKIKIPINSIVVFIICMISCSSYNKSNEVWEGISDNTLKIVISEFFPFEENTGNDKIKIILKQRLDERASLLIASHISINLSRDKISHKVDLTLNNLINDAIAGGKLLNYFCSENNHCTADAEYNITEIIKES